jgi:hypothetical protein
MEGQCLAGESRVCRAELFEDRDSAHMQLTIDFPEDVVVSLQKHFGDLSKQHA